MVLSKERINNLKRRAKNVRKGMLHTILKTGNIDHIKEALASVDLITSLGTNTLKEKELLCIAKKESKQSYDAYCYEFPHCRHNVKMYPLATAFGIALIKKERVYCLVGEKEMQDENIWDIFRAAKNEKVKNLCIIIERNYEDISSLNKMVPHLRSLGYNVGGFGNNFGINGHSIHSLELITSIFNLNSCFGTLPTVYVAKTKLGKGVPFLENNQSYYEYNQYVNAVESLQ